MFVHISARVMTNSRPKCGTSAHSSPETTDTVLRAAQNAQTQSEAEKAQLESKILHHLYTENNHSNDDADYHYNLIQNRSFIASTRIQAGSVLGWTFCRTYREHSIDRSHTFLQVNRRRCTSTKLVSIFFTDALIQIIEIYGIN